MKYAIVVAVLVVLIAIAQVLVARSSDSTEQQRYTVVYSEGDFEVRRYPEALLASVDSRDNSLRGSANNNFRRLAGYIFGGNDKGQKIAMTAPVHMEQAGTGSRMSFVMPSDLQQEKLPAPDDRGIVFHTSPEQVVAVVRFSGFASDDDIAQNTEVLSKWISSKGLVAASNFSYLGYNPPYQLVNRRNEVAVTVDGQGLTSLLAATSGTH
ncbi:MAG: SOUL family heme-binding protein [Bacteroidota bacterium]